MIAIQHTGRLGNQMFQYAFGYQLSKQLSTPVFNIPGPEDFDLRTYFSVPSLKPQSFFLAKCFRSLLYRAPFLITDLTDHITTLQAFKNGKIYPNWRIYRGFFQSLAYFENYREEIKCEFALKPDHITHFKREFLCSGENYIALHYRHGDYVQVIHNGNAPILLPPAYYYRAVKIALREMSLPVFVVTDSPQEATSVFRDFPDVEICHHSPAIDFQIIQNAKLAIISNSTFSWWAAFLGICQEQRVIAPQNWLGYHERSEYPAHISHGLDWEWIC